MKKNSAIAKRWLGVAAGSALAMGATVAQAAIAESEGNDTFATANAGAINDTWTGSIGDNTAASNDVDIWSISMTAGTQFNANINYTGLWNAPDVTPVMTLFMENGGNYYAVASTDPTSHGTSLSFLTWAAGNYFLSVSADFNQGVDAFGNFATDAYWQTDAGTLGTANAGFNGQSFTSFNYEVSAVPVPAAVWLFGTGLIGLVGMARRRKEA